MQELYSSEEGLLFRVTSVSIGLPVAVLYGQDNMWHRGEVVQIHPNSLDCDVMFIDFGEIQSVNVDRLRYLKKEFFFKEVSVIKNFKIFFFF